jgi:hypothetical protein
MQKLIRNNWHSVTGKPFITARILRHGTHPEGLNVERVRFAEDGSLEPESEVGHIISIIAGKGKLRVQGEDRRQLHLEPNVHLYIPPRLNWVLDAESGTEILHVSSPTASQARGTRLLLRDETFISACASGSQMLRWILTPQYLSRRIFLHHDPVLVSKSGNPVSWFRTTMFDVAGLPGNEEGESVFKMSYNSRTEFNVCYDVSGFARVRMAGHPYRQTGQLWGPWFSLDGDSTYHLNEAAGCDEEECFWDEASQVRRFLRNKHEVRIVDGHVTLFCMFDPAPAGIENHRPGEYSDYEPLSQVLGTESYERYQREVARYDEMVDTLSLAKAMGDLDAVRKAPVWQLYREGRRSQLAIESDLARRLVMEGNGRDKILAGWLQRTDA